MTTIGAIDWGAHDGKLVELSLAVMMQQDRPLSWRREPSRGDGGLDIINPLQSGFEVFQVKSFTKSLTAGQKRKIQNSLQAAIEDPRLTRPIESWNLVMPIGRTSGLDEWFDELTKDAPFSCVLRDHTWVERLAADQAHVVDWYFRDGKDRLLRTFRDLQNAAEITSAPVAELRPPEIAPALHQLYESINRSDPHYRYEYEMSLEPPHENLELNRVGMAMAWTAGSSTSGYATFRVFPKYAEAERDSAISLRFALSERQNPELVAMMNSSLDFGTPSEIPFSAIESLQAVIPGGFDFGHIQDGTLRITSTSEAFEPYRLRIVARGVEGTIVELPVDVVDRRSGRRGTDICMKDSAQLFTAWMRLMPAEDDLGTAELLSFDVSVGGQRAVDSLPSLCFLNALTNDVSISFFSEFGQSELFSMRVTSDVPPITTEYFEVGRILEALQSKSSIPIPLPAAHEFTSAFLNEVFTVWHVLNGGAVKGKWTEMTASLSVDELRALLGAETATKNDTLNFTISGQRFEFGPCVIVLPDFRIDGRDHLEATLVELEERGGQCDIRLVPGDVDEYVRQPVASLQESFDFPHD